MKDKSGRPVESVEAAAPDTVHRIHGYLMDCRFSNKPYLIEEIAKIIKTDRRGEAVPKQQPYDKKCEDLARYFLHVDSDEESIADLARQVQRKVNEFIADNLGEI